MTRLFTAYIVSPPSRSVSVALKGVPSEGMIRGLGYRRM